MSVLYFSFFFFIAFFGIFTKKQINDTKLKYSFFKEPLSTRCVCVCFLRKRWAKNYTSFCQSSLSRLNLVLEKLWRMNLNNFLCAEEKETTKHESRYFQKFIVMNSVVWLWETWLILQWVWGFVIRKLTGRAKKICWNRLAKVKQQKTKYSFVCLNI